MKLLPYSLFVRQQFPLHPKHPGILHKQNANNNFWCLLFMPSWVTVAESFWPYLQQEIIIIC